MRNTSQILTLAPSVRNKPFVLPSELQEVAGMGIWTEMFDGHNLFQESPFYGLTLVQVVDGMAERKIKMIQTHDADLGLSLLSSQQQIVETANHLVELCADGEICVEGVTCALFGAREFVGGATTNLATDVWRAALAKGLKTIILAAAINDAVAALPGKTRANLIYERVRELIGWPGGEEVDWLGKSIATAWNLRMAHDANVIAYAKDQGVATEENPLWDSEENKPWEPARKIVVPSAQGAIVEKLILLARIPPRFRKVVRLGINPEVAHENMSFACYWHSYELAAALNMLACVHLNGEQPPGVQDLDLAAMRRTCFNILFALRDYPNVPIVLDVKPDRCDLAMDQRWRVIDQSFRSLWWAWQAVKYVLADQAVQQILEALDQKRPINLLKDPIETLTTAELRSLAEDPYTKDELKEVQRIASGAGTLLFALDERIDELLHQDFK